jgi:ApaG protein
LIQNHSGETAQLLNRYWRITDANGHVQEVRGPGVLGEHPEFSPGKSYEYSSFTHLPTSTGFMEGSYEMKTTSGSVFQIQIPRFELVVACRLVVSN